MSEIANWFGQPISTTHNNYNQTWSGDGYINRIPYGTTYSLQRYIYGGIVIFKLLIDKVCEYIEYPVSRSLQYPSSQLALPQVTTRRLITNFRDGTEREGVQRKGGYVNCRILTIQLLHNKPPEIPAEYFKNNFRVFGNISRLEIVE